jgi:Rho family protein
MVEVATKDRIEKAEIDIIGLLAIAQGNNAPQLSNFLLHFLSTNFQTMKKRPEWKNMDPKNLKYVEENQWPPVSYLKELEEYEKAMARYSLGTEAEKNCSVM